MSTTYVYFRSFAASIPAIILYTLLRKARFLKLNFSDQTNFACTNIDRLINFLLLLLLRLLHVSFKIRQYHLFRSLFSRHLLRGLPTSLFPLVYYCNTSWGSIFATILRICSMHFNLRCKVIAFVEDILKSCLITSSLSFL